MTVLNVILPYFQIFISILLIISILIQQRGAGLGESFGGAGGVYYTKRGAERFLFISTIVLAFLFVTLSVLKFLI